MQRAKLVTLTMDGVTDEEDNGGNSEHGEWKFLKQFYKDREMRLGGRGDNENLFMRIIESE